MNEQGGACPRCAKPHAQGQQYCLECGARLDSAESAAGETQRPGRSWIWTALAALVVAAAGAAVAIVVSDNGNATTLTSTGPIASVTATAPPVTDTGALPPKPTTTAPVTTVATVPKAPEDTATSTSAKPALVKWPGKTAYTVVLVSLPSPGGHTGALARAHQALAKGLPQVGVLDSGDFPSLNPGYYVVFSGAYKTLLQAETGARNARFVGFGSAYPRQIKR